MLSRLRAIVASLSGPLLCAAIVLSPTPDGLTPEGQAALGVLALCVCWWLLTPVALPVTSLVGLGLLPMLGALTAGEALALFGNQAVFFVVGVFLVAAVMLQTGLSTRLTLLGLRRFATSENTLCNAVLFLSWGSCAVVVSHAVAAMLLPIVLGIISALDLGPGSRTARRLLLSMAWGTVAGSNLTLLSSARASLALELYGKYRADAGMALDPISFLQYAAGAAPLSVVSVLVAAVVLRFAFPPEGLALGPAVARLDAEVKRLGPMSGREWTTVAVITAMIGSMIALGPAWLGVLALLFSGLLFLLRVLRWEDAERYVNWGVVLMYGGAIAIGSALYSTGAVDWLVHTVIPDGIGPLTALAAIGGVTTAMTEVVSNSAVIAVVLPVGLQVTEQVGLDPRALAWTTPVCAGFAFVLPTSTPALAMVFGTGYLRVRHTLPGLVITAVSLLSFLVLARWLWPLLGIGVLAGAA